MSGQEIERERRTYKERGRVGEKAESQTFIENRAREGGE